MYVAKNPSKKRRSSGTRKTSSGKRRSTTKKAPVRRRRRNPTGLKPGARIGMSAATGAVGGTGAAYLLSGKSGMAQMGAGAVMALAGLAGLMGKKDNAVRAIAGVAAGAGLAIAGHGVKQHQVDKFIEEGKKAVEAGQKSWTDLTQEIVDKFGFVPGLFGITPSEAANDDAEPDAQGANLAQLMAAADVQQMPAPAPRQIPMNIEADALAGVREGDALAGLAAIDNPLGELDTYDL